MMLIIQGWLESREQKPQDIRIYETYRGCMVVIDGVIIKGKHIVMLEILQKQSLQELCVKSYGH